MKKATLLSLFCVLCTLLFSLALPFGSAAEEPTQSAEMELLKSSLTYDGMSMRLAGSTSGIRSLWRIDNTVVNTLEGRGYTVSYGAIMGVASIGTSNIREDAQDLTLVRDENLGFKLAEGVNNAAVCVVYETGLPNYATDTFVSVSNQKNTFAYTTLFGDSCETETHYNIEMVYRGFVALTKNGVTEIGYVDRTTEHLDTTVSLTDLATYFYHTYNGVSQGTYQTNRLLLRVLSFKDTVAEVDADNTTATLLSDNATYKLLVGEKLTLTVADVRATGFYKVTAKLNSNGQYLSKIEINRPSVNDTAAYTSGWRIGTESTLTPDGENSAYLTNEETERVVIGYQYLVAGADDNTLIIETNASAKGGEDTSTGTVGLSDIQVELIDLPIANRESFLLSAKEDRSQSLDTGNITTSGQGVRINNVDSSLSFTVTPFETGVYSAAMLSHMQKVTVHMTVTDQKGNTQVLSSDAAVSGLLPSGSSSIAAYYTLTGENELVMQADETYTVTVSIENTKNSSGSHIMYLEYLLLQRVDTYTENDNNIRVNLWETDVTGGALLSDRHTYFVNSGESLSFSVYAKKEGMYGVRMLETHAAGSTLRYTMQTAENTYEWNGSTKKFVYQTRYNWEGTTTAPTYTDRNEYIADQSMLKTELDGDYYGYIYLYPGNNTFTITMKDGSTARPYSVMGIAAMEFENVAPFNAETDVRIKAGEGATLSTGTVPTFNANFGFYTLGSYSATANPTLTYRFEITTAGYYDIYASGKVTGASNAKTSTAEISFAGVTDPTFTASASYTCDKLYMAIGNGNDETVSIAFDESIYFPAGTYTVTYAPAKDQRVVTLSDIRISRPQPVYVPATEASCVAGNIAYYYQASKDKCFSDPDGQHEISKLLTVIPPNGSHNYGNGWTVGVDATCTERGNEILVCSTCGESSTRATDPHGHTFTSEWTTLTAADCTTEGSERNVCDVCKKTVTRVIPATHRFGSWEKHVDPTLSAGGSLIRTCSVEGCGVSELHELPFLEGRNGYKLYDHCAEFGEVTFPTFEAAGSIIYHTRIDGQGFFYKADLPALGEYYASRTDVIVAEIENGTGNGTYNASTDTVHLPKNTEVSLTVTAPKAGFYNVYAKYSNMANKKTMIKVYNDSNTDWTAFAYSSVPTSPLYTDMRFDLYPAEVVADFPITESTTLYLLEGENHLRISFTTEVGLSDILFMETLIPDTSTDVVLPFNGSTSNNGQKFNTGKIHEISVTVPEDGTYQLYGMISTNGGSFHMASKEGSFATKSFNIPRAWGVSTTSDTVAVQSTYFRELISLPLTQGTHTIQFTMDALPSAATNYMHYNYLAFIRTGDLESDEAYTVNEDRTVNETDNTVTVSVQLSGTDTVASTPNMLVRMEGYYLYSDGTESAFTLPASKTQYSQSFSFTTDPLDAAKEAVSYRINVYSADGERLLHSGRLHHYSTRDTLTILVMSDLHHTGSNLTQLVRKYHYSETNHPEWMWGDAVLKTYNSNSTACDVYGMSTDEKFQRAMDDVIQRYEAGEIDLVVFTGDQSMNDGNYRNFAIQSGSMYGESIDDFWTSPLNLDLVLQEQYFSQLADRGIPFFCANGNHDYLMTYNEDKTEISYEPFEARYHYRELFGHKNADGLIYDATPVDYAVRAIRRDGEVKFLSSLSSEELRQFKLTHSNDWNNYDHYVSEDTLQDTDVLLGAFIVTAGYQIDSFHSYMEQYVYVKDHNGNVTTEKDFGFQTYRMDYHTVDVLNAMSPLIADYDAVYMMSHNYSTNILSFVDSHENIRGMFYGDLHEQVYDRYGGVIQSWCCGSMVPGFDNTTFYVRDENGNETKTPDNQYYGGGKIANQIQGRFLDYPYTCLKLHIRGTESYMEREHVSYFYKNTDPAYNIKTSRVLGIDPMYKRAVDYTKEAGTSFTVGNRTVFVGGDTFVAGAVGVGATYINIGREYTILHYNTPEFMLAPTEVANQYTVCDTAGRPVNANAKPVITDGGTAVVVTVSSTDEGTSLTLFGETYYMQSKCGGAVGHYLYDENGDFVYEDKDGNLVFYDFYKDENGDFMLEYFYQNENEELIPLGYWDETHTTYTLYDCLITNTPDPETGLVPDSYIMINGEKVPVSRAWLSGDRLTISALDHTRDEDERLLMVNNVQRANQFRVSQMELRIQDGVIIKGEGYMWRSYTHRLVDAYGNEVDASNIEIQKQQTWTYTIIDRDSYVLGSELKEEDEGTTFTITDNGLTEQYGMYMPRETYGETWLIK